MEDLVTLLNKLLEIPSPNVLAEDIIVVQNQGMHHWLSLELASRRGVIMNTRFPLPGGFFWSLIKAVIGDEAIPEVSPYSREILTWANFEMLGERGFINHEHCVEPRNYWINSTTGETDDLKRFQLAKELADLFEQYLIYRPEWVGAWERSEVDEWQGLLWQGVRKKLGDHPLLLIDKAVALLSSYKTKLPPRIFIFGLNALAPLWMDFLKAISAHTEVHFFMLNPSDEYWGDLKSEKKQVRERAQWFDRGSSLSAIYDDIGNPLLANLGQQGQECLKLICERSDSEIPLFYSPGRDSLLHCVQDDILTLKNRKEHPESQSDDSISIVSSHSALREIQVLHDWLLMQFKNDATLTPKDVLVMSPQVENYAPYIDSVFRRGWHHPSELNVQLPCSIADRKLSDAEPLIQAFIELLTLPDSRFQVSQILGYLRLPAVQNKYGIANEEVDRYVRWLNAASIHWGLDDNHKEKHSGANKDNNRFTWKQGLDRLLMGFAYGDAEEIYTTATGEKRLMLPWVEGDEAEHLGKLIRLIEQLSLYSIELNRNRSPVQWHQFLLSMVENLFEVDSESVHGHQVVISAIDSLVDSTSLAGFDRAVPLSVVSAHLNNCFNQPEQGQSFMTGQVTFCSMIPMRSVPFKIIAILGLNDGEFPRQRQPLGFDLLAASPPKLGDRSRRGDDRYLFLEALISARDKLYLSYQGNDIKNNQEKQPSLLLKELVDYMEGAYGWCSKDAIRRYPLQPFSHQNYQPPLYSFDAKWLTLFSASQARDNHIQFPEPVPNVEIGIEQLVSFFDNPAKAIAKTQLRLDFSERMADMPDDSEPFATNYLDRYLVENELIGSKLRGEDVEQAIEREVLRGHLPDTPRTAIELGEWASQSDQFSNAVLDLLPEKLERRDVRIQVGDFIVMASLPISGNSIVLWRPADAKGKDLVRMWLHHLVACIAISDLKPHSFELTQGVYRDQKKEGYKVLQFQAVSEPLAELHKWLTYWQQGMLTPLLIHAELARKVFEKTLAGKPFSASDFDKVWCDSFAGRGLAYDPYIQWFWETPPDWPGQWLDAINDLYGMMFRSLKEAAV